jgi:hypothetical protein
VAEPFFGVGRCQAVLHAKQPPQTVFERVERKQQQEQDAIQQLDRAHERQRHVFGSGEREHSTKELHQQQHGELHDPKHDRQPRRGGGEPDLQVDPERHRRCRAERSRVNEEDRAHAAGGLVEQAEEGAGAWSALFEHVTQACAVDIDECCLSGGGEE